VLSESDVACLFVCLFLVSNDAPMRDGELVLVDAGAVYVAVLHLLYAYLSADLCVPLS
jgi:hypothetical protein